MRGGARLVSAIAARAPRPAPAPRAAGAPALATLCALALLGASVVAATIWFGLAAGEISPRKLLTYQWMSAPYIAAGLVAWARRPESRLGPLMYVGGVATSLAVFQVASPDVLATLGAALDFLPAALFLHVFLAFPDGRLHSTFERALVAATYVAALALQLLRMSLGAFENEFEFTALPDAARALAYVQFLSVSALLVVGAGVLASRRRRATRRFLGLVIDLFALGLLLAAVLFVDAVFEGPGVPWIQSATWIVVGFAPLVFLLGLLDERLARSAVGDLFVDLRRNPAPAEVRDALARALRDDSLEIGFWLPEYGTYADLDGRPVDVTEPGDGRATTLIERDDDTPVAALVHDGALRQEPELLDAVAAAAAISLENARLHAELQARLEELKGSRARIVEAAQKERQRLERNLHDGAQQRLVALSLDLSLLQNQAADSDSRARIERARAEIAASLTELRELARGLHPAVVSAHGLDVALEQLTARAPVPVRLSVDTQGRLPEQLEVAAFYLVSESLANVGKYAGAASVSVEVSRRDGRLVVEVVDDGVGGADSARGSGLRGLADRVEALDGRLRVWSPAGGGTRVRAELPCG